MRKTVVKQHPHRKHRLTFISSNFSFRYINRHRSAAEALLLLAGALPSQLECTLHLPGIEMGFLLLNMATARACLFTFLAVCLSSLCVVVCNAREVHIIFFFSISSLVAALQVRDVKKWSSRGLNVVSCGYKYKLLTVFHFFCWFVLILFFILC